MEEWREIEDYPDYEVSNRGRVRSWKKNNRWGTDVPRMLSPSDDKDGYKEVCLYNNRGHSSICVHVLVLEAFLGPCPEGMETRHLDGDPSHNDIRNLCWGTPLENMADRDRHGTVSHSGPRNPARGRRNGSAIEFSNEAIEDIQDRHRKGEAIHSIARDYKVDWMLIRKIVDGAHWSQREDQ